MKKIVVSLFIMTIIFIFSLAFALPPTTEDTRPLYVMNQDFKPMVQSLDGMDMKNALLIYSDPKMEIYIFENFVKWEKTALEDNPTGGARGLKSTGVFTFAPEDTTSVNPPVLFAPHSRAGDYLQTGNFGMVLYYEIKDESLRKEAADEIRSKIKRRNEWEKLDQKYRNDTSRGIQSSRPDRLDMRDYLVGMYPMQDMDGVPKNAELFKYTKSTVFFDMKKNKMFKLKNLYIDQNGKGIAWSEFQEETDLSTNPMFSKIAKDIKAMLEQSAATVRGSQKAKNVESYFHIARAKDIAKDKDGALANYELFLNNLTPAQKQDAKFQMMVEAAQKRVDELKSPGLGIFKGFFR